MSMRETLTRLALIKAVKDFLAEEEKTTKAALMAEVGGRMGATAAILPSGEEGATVSIAKGRDAKLVVKDRSAFVKWVKANRPTAIVEEVRESDEKDLLDRANKGLLDEVPDGLDWSDAGDPYVAVKQSDAQAAATVAAWRAGSLEVPTPAPVLEDGAA